MSRAGPSIICPQCGRESWHSKDIEERYCANCHQYHDTMWVETQGTQRIEFTVHNHMTRDIKERGKCPACDEYHDRHG